MGFEDRHADIDSSIGEFFINNFIDDTGLGTSEAWGKGIIEVNVEKVYITEIAIGLVTVSGTTPSITFTLRERLTTLVNNIDDNGTTGWTTVTPTGMAFPTITAAGLYVYRPRGGIATLIPHFVDSSSRAVIQTNIRMALSSGAADVAITGSYWFRYKPIHVAQ